MSTPHNPTPSPEDQALKARFHERLEVLSGDTGLTSAPHPDFQRAWRQAQALSEGRAHKRPRELSTSWGLAALSLTALTLLFTFTTHEVPFSPSAPPTQRELTQTSADERAEEAWLEPLAWGSGWLEGEEWAPQWPSEPSSPPSTL